MTAATLLFLAACLVLAACATDMKQAGNALTWCVGEMERRYKLMSKMGVRNLAGYNAKIDEAKARGEFVYNPFSLTPEAPEPLDRLPHIVVVIDELADLMMVVGKKIEELIARLAQKARAAGKSVTIAQPVVGHHQMTEAPEETLFALAASAHLYVSRVADGPGGRLPYQKLSGFSFLAMALNQRRRLLRRLLSES